jgi:hypothetical protein
MSDLTVRELRRVFDLLASARDDARLARTVLLGRDSVAQGLPDALLATSQLLEAFREAVRADLKRQGVDV